MNKERGDPKVVAEGDELELTPDALRFYEERYAKRRELADDVRAEAGECEFKLGDSLRVTWIPHQRADRTLMDMFKAKELKDGFRFAPDGLLERQVQLPPPANATWVPVVPDGQATGNLSWKRWLFLQCHVGILGAHRNAERRVLIVAAGVVAYYGRGLQTVVGKMPDVHQIQKNATETGAGAGYSD